MPRITPLDPAAMPADTAAHLTVTRKMFGGTPNAFVTAAHSPAVLDALNGMFDALRRSSLGARRAYQLGIAVAQANGAAYCLSVNTALGSGHGLDPAALASAKSASATDPKTATLLRLAIAIHEARGQISDATLAEAHAAGISDAEIVEVVAHVALSVFTNYLNNVAETEIDFPVVALDPVA